MWRLRLLPLLPPSPRVGNACCITSLALSHLLVARVVAATVGITMSLGASDTAKLNRIAEELSDLAEQRFMDLIDEDQYAFKVHDALADLPEPPAPLHIHARAETGRLVWTVLYSVRALVTGVWWR